MAPTTSWGVGSCGYKQWWVVNSNADWSQTNLRSRVQEGTGVQECKREPEFKSARGDRSSRVQEGTGVQECKRGPEFKSARGDRSSRVQEGTGGEASRPLRQGIVGIGTTERKLVSDQSALCLAAVGIVPCADPVARPASSPAPPSVRFTHTDVLRTAVHIVNRHLRLFIPKCTYSLIQ
jgi:hypothetical protein